MSKVEVDQVDPQSGTTLTLGTSGDTINIPSGVTIANNGTASGFGDNLEWQSSIVTAATITVSANKGYWLDTSSNAITVTLPATAAVGDRLIFTDYARNWATNAVTINQNSLKFQGFTTPNPVYNTNGQSVDIVYSGATKGWIPNSDDDVTLETPQTYSADFLVIAGGSGGGGGTSGGAGGGGAGGYRASFNSESSGGGGSSETALTFNPSTVYTITVGAGGAGGTASDGDTEIGQPGNTSSISGSDITDITTVGGGGGGGGASTNPRAAGQDGGSGGGAGDPNGSVTPGNGTSNQGFNGGASASGGNDNYQQGGGGGGAGSVGLAASSTAGGNGGAGVASTITGSSVSRGGGGGGGRGQSASGAAGTATAGGGAGSSTGAGSAATANTGGGGGGKRGGGSFAGGNGGSGIVILRVPTSNYSGTTTGSPTVDQSTVSGQTILTFNASGSYTA